jgi:hypothetical protein
MRTLTETFVKTWTHRCLVVHRLPREMDDATQNVRAVVHNFATAAT